MSSRSSVILSRNSRLARASSAGPSSRSIPSLVLPARATAVSGTPGMPSNLANWAMPMVAAR